MITSGYFRLDRKKVLISAEKIKEILIDATELPAQRPKKKVRNKLKIKRSSKQKRKYSGKKKAHTHKIQVVENADTKQIICNYSFSYWYCYQNSQSVYHAINAMVNMTTPIITT